MEHQGSKTYKEIGKGAPLFDVVKTIKEDQDGYGVTHQVDHHNQTAHHKEDDDTQGEVGTIALQKAHKQDNLNERNDKLEEQVTIATCNPSANISQNSDARFKSERVTGKYVEVEVVGLHVLEHNVIARPVVAYVSSKSQEEDEQETTRHPHTLTKLLIQTVVA